MFRLRVFLFLICLVSSATLARASGQLIRIAVLDFNETATGQLAADTIANSLASADTIVLDRDESRAAAKGIGYSGSLNLTTQESKLLGTALGSDYYILGDAQILRRSPSIGPVYYESYASIFLVSSRTGSLIKWERPSFKSALSTDAAKLLLVALAKEHLRRSLIHAITSVAEFESLQRDKISEAPEAVIEEAPADEVAATAAGLQLPRPFRRLRPTYPDSAEAAEAEATVDVIADIDSNGEVTHAEIARWGGFGLDEASLQTVRQMHFFPALRNRTPIPIRVMLRYNFRKPAKQ